MLPTSYFLSNVKENVRKLFFFSPDEKMPKKKANSNDTDYLQSWAIATIPYNTSSPPAYTRPRHTLHPLTYHHICNTPSHNPPPAVSAAVVRRCFRRMGLLLGFP